MVETPRKSRIVVTGTTFLFFLLLQITLRFCWQSELTFLNEDSGLIINAVRSLNEHGPLYWFYHSYGPSILRPWQLLWMGIIGKFSTSPLFFSLAQIVLLALGQSFLLFAFRDKLGFYGAFITALLPSLSRASAESIYWLSAGHDLFLLLFGALSLFFLRRHLLFACLFLWCALLANEKAVGLPLVFSCYLLSENQSSKRALLKKISILFSSLPIYFLYRRWVLGSFIGGYTGRAFGEGFFTIQSLSEWILSTTTSLFWQAKGDQFFFVIGITCFLALVGATIWYERSRILPFFCLWLVAHIAFSLPTAQFALPPTHSAIFSTRMYWSSALSLSFLIGAMANTLLRRKQYLFTVGSIAVIIFSLSYSTRNTLNSFSSASRYTQRALSLFLEHCFCSDPKHPQTDGLPIHVATVNTFTEGSWLDYHALLSGAPKCVEKGAEKERCDLEFLPTNKKPRVIPVKSSLPLISTNGDIDNSLSAEKCFTFKAREIRRKHLKRQQLTITPVNTGEKRCNGLREFVITIDGTPHLKTTLPDATFRIKQDHHSPESHLLEIYAVSEASLARVGTFEFTGNGVF